MAKTRRVIVKPSKSGKIAPSRMKKVIRSVHVLPNDKGGWTVKKGGRDKVEADFSNKSDAVNYGRDVSRKKQSGMYIHFKNGKVKEVDEAENGNEVSSGRIYER